MPPAQLDERVQRGRDDVQGIARGDGVEEGGDEGGDERGAGAGRRSRPDERAQRDRGGLAPSVVPGAQAGGELGEDGSGARGGEAVDEGGEAAE